MKLIRNIAIPLSLFLTFLLCGCSTHYYRTDEHGVTLHLREKEAASVILFTSLDGFLPYSAEHADCTWTNRVPSNREFSYFYKVDGKYMIPDCRFKEKDDFGTENCIYVPGL